MPQEPHDIRYGVFYDIIGKAYTDAGEDGPIPIEIKKETTGS